MNRLLLALLVLVPFGLSAQAKISGPETQKLLAQDKGAVVLDVRTKEEWDAGRLSMAKMLPFDQIDAQTAAAAVPTKTTKVVVYCRSGRRSALAAQTLKSLGYTAVVDLGAITNWPGPLVK